MLIGKPQDLEEEIKDDIERLKTETKDKSEELEVLQKIIAKLCGEV